MSTTTPPTRLRYSAVVKSLREMAIQIEDMKGQAELDLAPLIDKTDEKSIEKNAGIIKKLDAAAYAEKKTALHHWTQTLLNGGQPDIQGDVNILSSWYEKAGYADAETLAKSFVDDLVKRCTNRTMRTQ